MIIPGFILDSTVNFLRPLALGYGARLYNLSGNYCGLKPAASITNIDWVLPSSDGTIGQYVKTDGSGNLSFSSVTIPVGANPAASIGLTAVNGSAATFMRSDAAQSLSQNIAPTMTGVWNFAPSARTATSNPSWRLQSPSDTALTASTECLSGHFGGNSSIPPVTVGRQWATGSLVQQRQFAFVGETISFAGASTCSVASTLDITAPIQGTNCTLTYPFALTLNGALGCLPAASGTDIAGGNVTYIAGLSRGQGRCGKHVFQVSGDNTISGSSINPPVTALTIDGPGGSTSQTGIGITMGDRTLNFSTTSIRMAGAVDGIGVQFLGPTGMSSPQTQCGVTVAGGFYCSVTNRPSFVTQVSPGGTNNMCLQATNSGPSGLSISTTTNVAVSGTPLFTVYETGAIQITPSAQNATSQGSFHVQSSPDTNLIANTECIGMHFGGDSTPSPLPVTRKWAAGTVPSQRSYTFITPKYGVSGAGSVIFTAASTLDIGGATIADTNVTITNNYALTIGGPASPMFGIGATGLISRYNTIPTTGLGVPAIYGTNRLTNQSGNVASVATYTVGTSDGSFEIGANVNVTTSSSHSFTVTCTYSDENNVSRTLTFSFVQNGVASIIQTITNTTGTGAYAGIPMRIRCKANTSITIASIGTFTTVAYNIEGDIAQRA